MRRVSSKSKENAAPSAAPMGGSTLTESPGTLRPVQPRVTKEKQRQMDVAEKKSVAAALLRSAFAQRKLKRSDFERLGDEQAAQVDGVKALFEYATGRKDGSHGSRMDTLIDLSEQCESLDAALGEVRARSRFSTAATPSPVGVGP